MPMNLRDQYLGQTAKNNQGYEMEVIEYIDYENIKVKFAPPYEGVVDTRMDKVKNGWVHNPFAPTVCGFGIVGTKYSTRDENDRNKHAIEYLTWTNMLKRCVSEREKKRCPTYINASCDTQWQYYENFYEWIHKQDNFEKLKEQDDLNLDKDILKKGNKIYGPDSCLLVPRKINNLLLGSNAIRGKYPIGVHYAKKNKKYVAAEGGHGNITYLGIFPTVEEAFETYKNFKEAKIKRMAEEEYGKGNITQKCYEALMNYEVKITD